MNYLDIAEQILQARRRGYTWSDFPGLWTYISSIGRNVESIGGQLISRQVIALAVETWFLINKIE